MSNRKINYNIAIFPGTFEYFHDGHISVLKKALPLFEKIYIVVSHNENKKYIPTNERKEKIINNSFYIQNMNKLVVIENEFYTVDILDKLNCYYIIRGVRDKNDFLYELNLYDSYKKIYFDFEIIYFLADINLRNISSKSIKREKHEK